MTTKKLPLSTSIFDLGLSLRATSRLQVWLGPEATLGDLVAHTERELRSAPGIGPKTYREIVLTVDAAGHAFERTVYECCNWCRCWVFRGVKDRMGVCVSEKAQHLATPPIAGCNFFEPRVLTQGEVRRRVEEIADRADCVGDVETAHLREDDLYHDFVCSLATRRDEIGRLARLVLRTRKLAFPRFCG